MHTPFEISFKRCPCGREHRFPLTFQGSLRAICPYAGKPIGFQIPIAKLQEYLFTVNSSKEIPTRQWVAHEVAPLDKDGCQRCGDCGEILLDYSEFDGDPNTYALYKRGQIVCQAADAPWDQYIASGPLSEREVSCKSQLGRLGRAVLMAKKLFRFGGHGTPSAE